MEARKQKARNAYLDGEAPTKKKNESTTTTPSTMVNNTTTTSPEATTPSGRKSSKAQEKTRGTRKKMNWARGTEEQEHGKEEE